MSERVGNDSNEAESKRFDILTSILIGLGSERKNLTVKY